MPDINPYDAKSAKKVAATEKQIDKLYKEIISEVAVIGASLANFDPNKPFKFSDYPTIKEKADKLLNKLKSGILRTITTGIDVQWALANEKNDELVRSVFGNDSDKLTDEQKKQYYSTNDAARQAFIRRQRNGLNLSDRVWKYTNQYKEEIEMALDLGIREGKSADELSRMLRQYLQQPDKLFRRVRDEHGKLQLSKNAKAYHPGMGVYRSSYKNARRLAATETNMAYRSADYERVQQLDFVVGIEVRLSNNHTLNGVPFHDICDELKGKYPKDFKFTGWHPLCRCHAVTILKTEKELEEDTDKILKGEATDTSSRREVKDVPQQFKDWLKDNEERMQRAKDRGTLPYFIRDNKDWVEGKKISVSPKVVKEKQVNIPKLDSTPKENIRKVIEDAKNQLNIEYRQVEPLSEVLSQEQIVDKLGGGDMTGGSCSSLAFAYAGNRMGYDVLDFRGGSSRSYFANRSIIAKIASDTGGVVVTNINDFNAAKELFAKVQEGKEYYMAIGQHAAIIRKMDNRMEYLELQSAYDNGFKELNTEVLKWRFRAQRSRKTAGIKFAINSFLIDIENMKSVDIIEMLGYINTEARKQIKGVKGTIK